MSDVKINRRLNLVLTVDRADGSTVHVHSVPVSQAVYEAHYTFFAKVMSSLYEDVQNPTMVARIAYLRMRDLIRKDSELPNHARKFAGVESGLLADMWRLTNVIAPGANGYETIPFLEAEQRGLIDQEDCSEIRNDIAFFTVASWIHSSKERPGMYELLDNTGAQTTSLDVTEYLRSLPTLKPAASTGATEKQLSIPS